MVSLHEFTSVVLALPTGNDGNLGLANGTVHSKAELDSDTLVSEFIFLCLTELVVVVRNANAQELLSGAAKELMSLARGQKDARGCHAGIFASKNAHPNVCAV